MTTATTTCIDNTVIPMNETATIQFGNETDSSGFRVVTGDIIAKQHRMVTVYLVRDGNTFGVATIGKRDGIEADYYCTNAMTLGREFRGHKFTEQDIARHLGFPVDLIKVPATTN